MDIVRVMEGFADITSFFFSLNVRMNRNAFPNMLLLVSFTKVDRCFCVTFIDLLQVLKYTFTLSLLRQDAFFLK